MCFGVRRFINKHRLISMYIPVASRFHAGVALVVCGALLPSRPRTTPRGADVVVCFGATCSCRSWLAYGVGQAGWRLQEHLAEQRAEQPIDLGGATNGTRCRDGVPGGAWSIELFRNASDRTNRCGDGAAGLFEGDRGQVVLGSSAYD